MAARAVNKGSARRPQNFLGVGRGSGSERGSAASSRRTSLEELTHPDVQTHALRLLPQILGVAALVLSVAFGERCAKEVELKVTTLRGKEASKSAGEKRWGGIYHEQESEQE